jgi:hypothetical protein
MSEVRRNSNGDALGPRVYNGESYDDLQLGVHNHKFPAQPDTLTADGVLSMLDESIASLKDVRFALRNTTPSKARRGELRRQISGVLGTCETVRKSIRE